MQVLSPIWLRIFVPTQNTVRMLRDQQTYFRSTGSRRVFNGQPRISVAQFSAPPPCLSGCLFSPLPNFPLPFLPVAVFFHCRIFPLPNFPLPFYPLPFFRESSQTFQADVIYGQPLDIT